MRKNDTKQLDVAVVWEGVFSGTGIYINSGRLGVAVLDGKRWLY